MGCSWLVFVSGRGNNFGIVLRSSSGNDGSLVVPAGTGSNSRFEAETPSLGSPVDAAPAAADSRNESMVKSVTLRDGGGVAEGSGGAGEAGALLDCGAEGGGAGEEGRAFGTGGGGGTRGSRRDPSEGAGTEGALAGEDNGRADGRVEES
ncbi:MAG TPA: hypothetical protein VGJ84_12780 [Polyangiaceae bacterium]